MERKRKFVVIVNNLTGAGSLEDRLNNGWTIDRIVKGPIREGSIFILTKFFDIEED